MWTILCLSTTGSACSLGLASEASIGGVGSDGSGSTPGLGHGHPGAWDPKANVNDE